MDLEQTAIERLKMASDMSLRLYKQPLVSRTRAARTLTCCCIWLGNLVSRMRCCIR